MAPPKRLRLGILTPSSNTALEPLTSTIISSLPDNKNFNVTVHFSRFPVTEISLTSKGLTQFQHTHILAAAQLLADAHVDIIGWSGTSSGWLGFKDDDDLCKAITDATGIPATTSVLALNKALKLLGATKLGLVTPYLDEVQAKIVANYATIGVQISEETERHLRLSVNSSFADVDEDTLDGMVADVVKGEKVQAVTTFCTNLIAAQRVELWEEKYGVPVLDTVTTVVWDMLRAVGFETKAVKGWGKIFEL